ncbi:MAG: PASTA domain-containing protein, partial [Nitriliruptoraceae bacterium]
MSVGRILSGRYELSRLLGRGGMAEVWAAHDHTLSREVAIKLLLDRFLDDESFTRRFQDEARHVARLNHPNLVGVYDTGADQGQPYIVMELVEGRSLQQVIAAGGLPEDRALQVVGQVCAALAYAHDRGLIHRDVKPGNILIADDGTVKVTDFGIARAVDNETVTRTAAVLGTAAYLSPEQAQGLDVDPRSDLYSLGVVLYELLTGDQPFVGDTPVTVAYQHVQQAPRPPRELDISISPAAEAITMRALAKNPANRYQHAGEMAHDIHSARTGGPITAPAVLSDDETALLQPDFGHVRSPDQQRRWRAIAYTILGVLAVASLVGIGMVLASLFNGDAPERVVVPNVVNLPLDDAESALEANDLLVGEVTEEASDTVASGLVIRQRPGPEMLVVAGSAVDLVISAGQDTTFVPDLIGLLEDVAVARLVEHRLVAGDRTREHHDDVEEGRIIRHDPAEGAELRVGDRVALVVSLGVETVIVRPVANRSEDDAIFRLEDQGLEVEIEREHSSVVSEGFVIRQDPEAGTEVRPGTIVTIVVSLGPEETEEEAEEEAETPPPSNGDGGNGGDGGGGDG